MATESFKSFEAAILNSQYIATHYKTIQLCLKVFPNHPKNDGLQFVSQGLTKLKALFLAPIAVKILLRRGSAQKIGAHSGKSSQKTIQT